MMPAPRGLVGFGQTFTGTDTRVVVTHGAFMVARVTVCEGRLFFPLAAGEIEATGHFLLRIPPRCTVAMRFENARVESVGMAGFTRPAFTSAALLDDRANGHLQAIDLTEFATVPVRHELDADAGVPTELVQARMFLHEALAHPAPVRLVSRRLGLRSDVLSRNFARVYHLAPKQYCHRARLFEAVLRLAAGGEIIESALRSGFGDLKRFYAQFRRLIGATPGLYAGVKKRQDRALRHRR